VRPREPAAEQCEVGAGERAEGEGVHVSIDATSRVDVVVTLVSSAEVLMNLRELAAILHAGRASAWGHDAGRYSRPTVRLVRHRE
jgi:hypothetical protein